MALNGETYVNEAEKVIKSLIIKDRNGNDKIELTTSQLRNILGMIADIYNDVMVSTDKELTAKQIERVQYLKIKILYAAGREPKVVKPFVDKAHLIEYIDGIKNSKKAFVLFNRYMEALVAYHKFYGGND